MNQAPDDLRRSMDDLDDLEFDDATAVDPRSAEMARRMAMARARAERLEATVPNPFAHEREDDTCPVATPPLHSLQAAPSPSPIAEQTASAEVSLPGLADLPSGCFTYAPRPVEPRPRTRRGPPPLPHLRSASKPPRSHIESHPQVTLPPLPDLPPVNDALRADPAPAATRGLSPRPLPIATAMLPPPLAPQVVAGAARPAAPAATPRFGPWLLRQLAALRAGLDITPGSLEAVVLGATIATVLVGTLHGLASHVVGELPMFGVLAGTSIGSITRLVSGSARERVGLGALVATLIALTWGKVIVGNGVEPFAFEGWFLHHSSPENVLMVWMAGPAAGFVLGVIGHDPDTA